VSNSPLRIAITRRPTKNRQTNKENQKESGGGAPRKIYQKPSRVSAHKRKLDRGKGVGKEGGGVWRAERWCGKKIQKKEKEKKPQGGITWSGNVPNTGLSLTGVGGGKPELKHVTVRKKYTGLVGFSFWIVCRCFDLCRFLWAGLGLWGGGPWSERPCPCQTHGGGGLPYYIQNGRAKNEKATWVKRQKYEGVSSNSGEIEI